MLSDLAQLLDPVSPETFHKEYLGRRPLHIPATGNGDKRTVLDWAAFNALIGQTANWTANSLRLMVNGVAVPPSEYCEVARTPNGEVLRPSPPKVERHLNLGASVVVNEVQTLHPPIAAAATMLGRSFAAQVGANVYSSFQDIQAFPTHYDVHDVFAVQAEGTKLWRIYSTQSDVPVELPPDSPETRQWLTQSRGQLVQEVLMKPGDVLYLPRGRFHDALATDGASLHVTFSVTALHGSSVLSLLENAAKQFPVFREYLPVAHQDDGRALSQHLSKLSAFLAELMASPAFRDEIAMAQERLVLRHKTYSLPLRTASPVYRMTGKALAPVSTPVMIALDWCRTQERFSLDQVIAEFDFVNPDLLKQAIQAAEESGAITRVG